MIANFEGYVSLVRGAAGGNETLRAIYEEVRDALDDRIFLEDAQGEVIADTPHNRLMVRGWPAMTEELVIAWRTDPGDVTPRGPARDHRRGVARPGRGRGRSL